ncbi:phosphoglycerate mutase-like protein, partial [Martensiomyces pterosporus]
LFLARHGQTAANASSILQGSRLNYPLNEHGHQQAAALAEGLKNQEIDWIITSKLERAIQTAQAVGKYHPGAPFTSDARLNEISWGVLDGTDITKAKPTLNPVVERWKAGDFDARVEDGDSAAECRERSLQAFSDILQEVKEKKYRNVFICIHGRILRVIMATLVAKDLRKMPAFAHTNCCYHHISVELGED